MVLFVVGDALVTVVSTVTDSCDVTVVSTVTDSCDVTVVSTVTDSCDVTVVSTVTDSGDCCERCEMRPSWYHAAYSCNAAPPCWTKQP